MATASQQAEARLAAFLTFTHREFDPTVTAADVRKSACLFLRVDAPCGDCDERHPRPVVVTHN